LYNVANVNVPIDDTNTCFYFIAWGHPAQTPETETWRKFLGQTVGVDLDTYYRPLRNYDNRFWQDRQAMKAGNFTGIKGFPNQDIAMWVTMGKIADRSQDRLGASDLAIVEFRKQMVEAVKQYQQDATAIGTAERQVPAHVCAYQQVLPKTDDWRSFEGRYIWDDADASAQSDNAYVVKV
jgi:phthalate 4,5-dioxygenase oxygenase subunit